jgi:hypothetical protein
VLETATAAARARVITNASRAAGRATASIASRQLRCDATSTRYTTGSSAAAAAREAKATMTAREPSTGRFRTEVTDTGES